MKSVQKNFRINQTRYNDHIEFYLNTIPADILRGEIDRSLGIGDEETLVEHMTRCEPQIMNAMRKLASKGANMDGAVTDSGGSSDFHRKKADKSAKNGELSTFIGYVVQKRCRGNDQYLTSSTLLQYGAKNKAFPL